jgi:hypothetical protein
MLKEQKKKTAEEKEAGIPSMNELKKAKAYTKRPRRN